MEETKERILSAAEHKRRIRECYKGVDPDSLSVIPAIPWEDFYKTESVKWVAVSGTEVSGFARDIGTAKFEERVYRKAAEGDRGIFGNDVTVLLHLQMNL